MPTEIRKLAGDELEQFARIARPAYPGVVVSPEDLVERLRRTEGGQDPAISSWGAFREGELLGVMRCFDFTMSCHGELIPVGGVGFVAVDLLHKKEHVARDMIAAFLRHYREAGAPLAALYPFRPDFYRKMGFGYGTRLNAYNLRADAFPQGERGSLRHLGRADAAAILACHNRYVAGTHGPFLRGEALMGRMLESPERRVVGFMAGEEVQGYLIYQFQRGARSFIDNSLEVVELAAEHPAALRELLAFIRSQADQVQRVIWHTHDDQIHHLVSDPRNGSENLLMPTSHETNAQGVGIMYRLLDTAGFFRAMGGHSFGGQSLTLGIDVHDSFLPENDGQLVVHFAGGRPKLDHEAEPEVWISLSVEHLSSLVIGSADFRALLAYRLAEIDNPSYSGRVHRLFQSEARPICLTAF
jgi:predicted acetyltransferase